MSWFDFLPKVREIRVDWLYVWGLGILMIGDAFDDPYNESRFVFMYFSGCFFMLIGCFRILWILTEEYRWREEFRPDIKEGEKR